MSSGTRLSKQQSWPGWYTDAQLAAEHAQTLSRQLAASVNAGRLAAAWLALHGTDVTTPASAPDEVAKARRKRRKRRRRGGGQQRQQQPPVQQQTAARQFLINQGVVAAITAILLSLLTALWGAAWGLGWASAVAVLGVGQIEGSEKALTALLAEAHGRIAGILQTRLSRLERVLEAALRDGTSADELARQISDILGSLTSALLVTQTEVTWMSGWAAYWAYKFAGVKWVRWQTRNDSRVCAKCMANQKASPIRLGQKFPSGNKSPLAHPRCVIGSTRIAAPSLVGMAGQEANRLPRHMVGAATGEPSASAVAIARRDDTRGNLRAVSDREYVGDVVTIRTASGKELTATPNHPVATRAGWVPVAELAVGDHVLSSTGPEWEASPVHPDVDDIPPCIEEVAQSLPVLFGAVPLTSEDFHGDGAGSEVCVVRADGFLVDDAQAGMTESTGECLLCGGDVAAGSTLALDAEGFGDQELLRLGHATLGLMRGGGDALTFFGRGLRHAGVHGFAAAPWRDAGLGENYPDIRALNAISGGEGLFALSGEVPGYDLITDTPEAVPLGAIAQGDIAGFEDAAKSLVADTKGFCEILNSLAGNIAADEIIQVNRWVLSGHVYNLDTVEGWYIGNGIITHNCRCSLLPAEAPKAS